MNQSLYLEGLVGIEHWCNLVPTVGAPYPAELAYQPLTRLTVVGHLFLVVRTHQTLKDAKDNEIVSQWRKSAHLPAIGGPSPAVREVETACGAP